MRITFEKYHGAGNDFVMIDNRSGDISMDAAFVARLANRPDGIGCEGVIFVCAPNSSEVDFAMRFFNPDGSEADLCGNGARCVAAFALTIGAAKSPRMSFSTRAGKIFAEVISSELVKISMPAVKELAQDFVNTGVPHAIVPIVGELSKIDVANEGCRIRNSVAFAPAGTNVDFVRYLPPHRALIRTYERGVEAETFACGTGSVAAAVVGVAQHHLAFPVTVVTSRNCELVVDGTFADGQFSSITLTGPVKCVFSGVIES